jgi:hypothetical protein
MGFFLPLNQTVGTEAVDGFELAGATALEVAGEVMKTARATFAGATSLDFFHAQGAALFAGATSLEVAGRLNDEANVLGAVEFAGATLLEIASEGARAASATFAGATALEVAGHLDRAQDFGFTFFVDVVGSSVAAALALPSNTRRFTARLLVNGSAVPIIRATINAPDDKLGVELSVVLARADVTQIAVGDLIDFQLGLWTGAAWAWSTMISQGRMSGRGAHYANQEGLPADSVEVSFVDIVGDRWNRAPRRPLFYYDPQIVDAPTSEAIAQQRVYDQLGAAIEPLYVAVSGMMLYDVLRAAYVDGCGFSKFVTNIENFAVEEVAFSMTGGFDAGVRPLLSPFEPLVFPVGNDLWIITLDSPLPAGFSARTYPSKLSLAIDDSLPTVEAVNGLLVTLKDTGTGEYFTERLETSTTPHGTFGSDDFTESDIERRVREYRTFSNPAAITREDEVYLKTRTLDSDLNEIALETLTHYFDALNRPTGYLRQVSSLLPDPSTDDAARILQPSLEESQRITYGVHPLNAARDVQQMVETQVSGLILVDEENQYLGKPYKIPLHDAHKSGYVEGGANQTTTFGALRTITETLRVQGGQVLRDRRVVNHVAGVEEPPVSQVLPGDAGFDRRRGTGKTRTVLLTVSGTDATPRRVASFDATGLPPNVGLALAAHRLANYNNPPRVASVEATYPDPMMRRGLDLLIQGRDGALGTFIVRGYSMTVAMQESGAIDATMNFTARELKS